MQVYTIDITKSFIDEVAIGIIKKYKKYLDKGEFCKLRNLDIFLPNHRTCNLLKQKLLSYLGKDSLILPNIMPIGEDSDPDLDNNKIMDLTLRKLLFAQEVSKMITLLPENQIKQSSQQNFNYCFSIACEIIELFDELERENVDISILKDKNFSQTINDNFGLNLFLITSLSKFMLEIRKERDKYGYHNIWAYRKDLITKRIEYYQNNKDRDLIIAGSTGSIPMIRDFIAELAKLPNTHIILSGINLSLNDEEIKYLPKYHGQYLLYELIKKIGISKNDIKNWHQQEEDLLSIKRQAKKEFLSKIDKFMSLSEKVDNRHINEQNNVTGNIIPLEVVNANNDYEEMIIISLMAYEFINKYPDKKVAIISNNSDLKNRIYNILLSWNSRVSNVVGKNITSLASSNLFVTIARIISNQLDIYDIVKLLKSDSINKEFFNLSEADYRKIVTLLEKRILRGNNNHNINFYNIIDKIHNEHGLSQDSKKELISFMDNLLPLFLPISEILTKNFLDIKVLAKEHLALFYKIINPNIINLQDDNALKEKEIINKIYSYIEIAAESNNADYFNMINQIFLDVSYYEKQDDNPSIELLAPVEARLFHHDLTIIADFNENSWPKIPADNMIFNGNIRKFLNIELDNKKLSLSLYDFLSLIASDEVVITRSIRYGKENTIESRWKRVIEIVNKQNNNLYLLDNSKKWQQKYRDYVNNYKSYFINQDKAERDFLFTNIKPIEKLSVTEIDTLLIDPYKIYAKHILKLLPIKPFYREKKEDALFGNFIHNLLEQISNNYHKIINQENFCHEMLDNLFTKMNITNNQQFFWQEKIDYIIDKYLKFEKTRRSAADNKEIFAEYKLSEDIMSNNGKKLTISTKIDRLELTNYPDIIEISLIDYKTGTVKPYSKQLEIEAIIIKHYLDHDKDFTKKLVIKDMIYFICKKDGDNKILPNDNIEHAEILLDKIIDALNQDEVYFLPTPNLSSNDDYHRYNEYLHLERIINI